MIERFSSSASKGLIKKLYSLKTPPEYKPVYNASVKIGKVPVLTADNPYRVELMAWGLMPFDSEDPMIATKLTNARSHTLKAKQPYCDMLEKKRCVILMDGFYVWKEVHSVKTPYRVVRKDGNPFFVAGLWDDWKQEDSEDSFFKTFSMVTEEAFELSKEYNDRMPSVLSDEAKLLWLDEDVSTDIAMSQLKTVDESDYRIYRVTNLVNNHDINTAKVIKELNAPSMGDTLSLFD